VSVLADRLSRHQRVVPSASLDKSKVFIQLWQSNGNYIGRYYMGFEKSVKEILNFSDSRIDTEIVNWDEIRNEKKKKNDHKNINDTY
jgi:hypothetical protein